MISVLGAALTAATTARTILFCSAESKVTVKLSFANLGLLYLNGFESLPHQKREAFGPLFFGAGDRTRTCTLTQRNLNPPSLPIPPRPHSLFILSRPHSIVNPAFSTLSRRARSHCVEYGSRSATLHFPVLAGQIVQNISQLPLTIWTHPSKIDSVWCTMPQCF